ncbi:unnamed protein product [Linum trigynum]|uniref:BED-type domain-containing protein n=1 Tax=Linum trigynum TaxID=586398 RepID=A0AAV2DUM4_9ROSI
MEGSSSWGSKKRVPASRESGNLPPLPSKKRPQPQASKAAVESGNNSGNVNVQAAATQEQERPAATNTTTTPEMEKTNREYVLRSPVWQHYDCYKDAKGKKKAKCHYCGKSLAGDPSGNGTSSLGRHTQRCLKKQKEKGKQLNLELNPTSVEGEGVLGTWKFDQEFIRAGLVEMIILDEMPFRSVEKEGFKRFMARACPMFKIPSRRSVREDCFRLFLEQKGKLRDYFKIKCGGRVSITTDSWTSCQNFNYMCITAHFVGKDWKLYKKVISFCKITSHKGIDLGDAIADCLEHWGLKNIFTVTVDNASANDTTLLHLKDRLEEWGTNIVGGKYLHMRCIAHIVNLIVSDGLEEMGMSIRRVREAVRWVRSSPSRLAKFKECVEFHNIESKKMLSLDVPTRWNSTYYMLEAAVLFEDAFSSLERKDKDYKPELKAKRYKNQEIGVPQHEDWKNAKVLMKYLKFFHDLTLIASTTSVVTAHRFLREFGRVLYHVEKMMNSTDDDIVRMGMKMKAKVDKYWSEKDCVNFRLNRLVYMAVVFDPRNKMNYPEHIFKKMCGDDRAKVLVKELNDELEKLFEYYQSKMPPPAPSSPSKRRVQVATSSSPRSGSDSDESYDDYDPDDDYGKPQAGHTKSELEKYLVHPREYDDAEEEFDVLKWWKTNAMRYPILSEMAKDLFAIPMSTVPSESVFSTSGRVLDEFRSSLHPKIVEALICSQDWLRSSSSEFVEHLDGEDDDYEDQEDFVNGK